MDGETNKLPSGYAEKTNPLFLEFMTRIMKFDELASIGTRLLVEFHRQLEWIRRPPLHQTSKVVEGIISANQTERMMTYVESGCRHMQTAAQKVAQLHSCRQDLLENLAKIKNLLDELESLAEDAVRAMQSVFGYVQDISIQKAEEEPHHTHVLEDSDYTSTMVIITNMYKFDYTMQEKVVLSLGLKSSSEELENYCLMSDLRPYINEELMQEAWKHVP